jgi:starvation-inducible outer membrane lipoprotein
MRYLILLLAISLTACTTVTPDNDLAARVTLCEERLTVIEQSLTTLQQSPKLRLYPSQATLTVLAGTTATVLAPCLTVTDSLLTGGCTPTAGLTLQAMGPADALDVTTLARWSCTVTNPTDQDLTVTAQAICSVAELD